jgi:hypothetical protein
VNREEIERSFVGASWEVCEFSSPHLLLVGNAGDKAFRTYNKP